MGLIAFRSGEPALTYMQHEFTEINPSVREAFLISCQLNLSAVSLICLGDVRADRHELNNLAAEYGYSLNTTCEVDKDVDLYNVSMIFTNSDFKDNDMLKYALTINDVLLILKEKHEHYILMPTNQQLRSLSDQDSDIPCVKKQVLNRADRRNKNKKDFERAYSKIPPKRL